MIKFHNAYIDEAEKDGDIDRYEAEFLVRYHNDLQRSSRSLMKKKLRRYGHKIDVRNGELFFVKEENTIIQRIGVPQIGKRTRFFLMLLPATVVVIAKLIFGG